MRRLSVFLLALWYTELSAVQHSGHRATGRAYARSIRGEDMSTYTSEQNLYSLSFSVGSRQTNVSEAPRMRRSSSLAGVTMEPFVSGYSGTRSAC